MSNKTPIVQPWKTLGSTRVLNEKWLSVRRDVVQLPSGRIVDDYFVWDSPKVVMIVAVTPDGKFVMVRQYRYAIDKILTQFPAGGVDDNEEPAVAALRELEEETGYSSTDTPLLLGKSAPYSTKITTIQEIYLITNVVPTKPPHEDDQEVTEVLLYTTADLLSLISGEETLGTDVYACAMLGLLHLGKLSKIS